VAAASDGPGKGATFTIRLPAIEQPAAAPDTIAPPPPTGRRILVVDDNKDARETLAAVLELDGHHIVQAADGPEALARLAGFHADAAIIDIGLPGMDGYQVARNIRSHPQSGKPPVLIALTGYGLPEDQRRAREAGFDVHMVKPADFDRLLKIIETAE
jgi:CheY-like chemotaxis protein